MKAAHAGWTYAFMYRDLLIYGNIYASTIIKWPRRERNVSSLSNEMMEAFASFILISRDPSSLGYKGIIAVLIHSHLQKLHLGSCI